MIRILHGSSSMLIAMSLLLFVPLAGASSVEQFSLFLKSTLSGKTEFEQKIYDGKKKLVQQSRGTFLFQRPGRFRWTYVKPYPQLIVGDGTKVWIYDEDLNQVTVRKFDQALGSTPAALLSGNNEVVKAFKITDQGSRRTGMAAGRAARYGVEL